MKRGKLVVRIATDTKPSNPKEAFGDLKMVDGLVPETAILEEGLAFLEGALKYGQYNWRVVGVKASTYRRAIGRHLKKWWNGQDRDPVTMVLELASVRACCGIIIDAIAAGKFTDDRPPRADIERTLADAAKVAAHLKQLFKDHTPVQYTQQWVDDQAVKDVESKGCAGKNCGSTVPGLHSADCFAEHERVTGPKKRTAADRRKATLRGLSRKHGFSGKR